MTETEIVDQQWVPDMERAVQLKKTLLSTARSQGMLIGIKPGGGKHGGYLVTIEREIAPADGE